MAYVYHKGLEGHAGAADPNDDLDVTKPNNSNGKAASSVPESSSSTGLSMMSKLFFASLVVAGCVAFVKTRRSPSSMLRSSAR